MVDPRCAPRFIAVLDDAMANDRMNERRDRDSVNEDNQAQLGECLSLCPSGGHGRLLATSLRLQSDFGFLSLRLLPKSAPLT
jgi:hypothetical protein